MIAVIVGILILTTQTERETLALSQSFRDWLTNVCRKIGVDADTEWWNSSHNVRLLGHVIEYFLLGLASGIAFEKKWKCVVFCMAVSFLDQITKVFVPVRHFDIRDIPFDIVGFLSGILIIWVITIVVRACRTVKTEEA